MAATAVFKMNNPKSTCTAAALTWAYMVLAKTATPKASLFLPSDPTLAQNMSNIADLDNDPQTQIAIMGFESVRTRTNVGLTSTEVAEAFKKQLSKAEDAHLETKKMLQRESGEICPVCSRPLLIKFGKHGEFLACSGFPSCRYTQPIKKKGGNAALETPDVACPKCGSFMVVRSGRFGEFLACNRYPECKTTLPLMTGLSCPRAECDGTIVIKRSKGGKRFFGCSNYPECDFVSWNEPIAALCPDCGAKAAIRKKKAGNEFLSCLGCGRESPKAEKKDSG